MPCYVMRCALGLGRNFAALRGLIVVVRKPNVFTSTCTTHRGQALSTYSRLACLVCLFWLSHPSCLHVREGDRRDRRAWWLMRTSSAVDGNRFVGAILLGQLKDRSYRTCRRRLPIRFLLPWVMSADFFACMPSKVASRSIEFVAHSQPTPLNNR